MPILILYLFKLFVSLGIVFLFYQLVLRRVTFYNANRWYLVGFITRGGGGISPYLLI